MVSNEVITGTRDSSKVDQIEEKPRRIDFNKLKTVADFIDYFYHEDQKLHELMYYFPSNFSKDYTSDTLLHYKLTKSIPLPDYLLKEIDKMNTRCYFGIFPEITRVWMSIDHRLYLWNYETGNDVDCYDKLDSFIITVQLVKPKADVFVEKIEYLLVVSTPVSIHLLGIRAKDSSLSREASSLSIQEYDIIDTQLTATSDGVGVLSIIGTRTGRIFMSGNDGNVYELKYSGDQKWFGKRCKKINHTSSALTYLIPTFLKWSSEDPVILLSYDYTRNYLFSLSENSVIKAFFLGKNDDRLDHFYTISNAYDQFAKICSQSILFRKDEFNIISIHAITSSESSEYNLLAVTVSGVRLYFKIRVRSYSQYIETQGSPEECYLVHVRLPYSVPSGFQARGFGFGQLNLHNTYYNRGSFIAAHSGNQDEDCLWILDTNPMENYLNTVSAHRPADTIQTTNENHCTLSLKGKTWAISETVHPLTFDRVQSKAKRETSVTFQYEFYNELAVLNEYIDQTFLSHRKFLVLTNAGLNVYTKLKSMDVLNQLILEAAGYDSEHLKNFFAMFGRDQACSIALNILCMKTSSLTLMSPSKEGTVASKHSSLENWTLAAFFKYSGEPLLLTTPYESQHRPFFFENSRMTGSAPIPAFKFGNENFQFSGKHNSLFLNLERSLRRIWKMPFSLIKDVSEKRIYISNLLSNIQNDLFLLLDYIKRNINNLTFNFDGSISYLLTNATTSKDAQKRETENIYSAQYALKYLIESISLVLVIMDHPLNDLIRRLPSILVDRFHSYRMDTLLNTFEGYELLIELATSLLQRYLEKDGHLDPLLEILLQRCPLFFDADDVKFYNAYELLHKAKKVKSLSERKDFLKQSLVLISQTKKDLTLSRLSKLSEYYRQLYYHPFAIQLCIDTIESRFPESLTISSETYEEIENIYRIIFILLKDARDLALYSNKDLEPEAAKFLYEESLKNTQSYHRRDYLALYYNHILNEGWFDLLIQASTPYIEDFLKEYHYCNEIVANPEILWKWYTYHSKYYEACKVLLELADDANRSFNLNQRLEYLSLAIANSKSLDAKSSIKKDQNDLFEELDQRLEVASIQFEVYNRLEKESKLTSKEKDLLNVKLLTLSELYNQFAEPKGLWDVCLRMINVAQFSEDPQIVYHLWTKIIVGELSDNRDKSVAFKCIKLKIIELGKDLLPSLVAVPIEYLTQYLERLCFNHYHACEQGFTVYTLHEAGVSFISLFNALNILTETKTQPWNHPTSLLCLFEDLSILLKEWFTKDRQNYTLHLKQINTTITKYLAALAQMDKGTRISEQLVDLMNTTKF